MELFVILLLTLLAGSAMPAGAFLAAKESIRPNWLRRELRHGVIAFGGGALLSAVALVLVPDGLEGVSTTTALICFLAGALVFMLIDILLNYLRTSASQLIAMLADFIPESIAMGAAFAHGSSNALLLALLIGMQNLPEGFNAFRELKETTPYRSATIIRTFALMVLTGPLAGLIGFLWLADLIPVVSGIMLFAAGGILYSVFQDIAPQARLENHWAPPLGAVLGFALGMLGHQLTG
ncbi:ZIP family metal transporter [Marinospirillum perlucidum]|uniref:ZIP family metal transporter n=1 Tax=Marinospirillum perlucidum TaxID=1982602 RepID=UPI000DF17D48|nr:divalent cation transporter [Marinospirillum perlucidum]